MWALDGDQFCKQIIEESRIHKTVDYGKFIVVKETSYSSVRPYHFLQIGKILKRIFKKPKIAIDMCAHIGGSTINIAHLFPNVKIISVELRKSVFNTLRKNVLTFGYQKRISLVNDNCISFLKKISPKKIKIDFIHIDPPWGGPGYTRVKKLMLTLNNTSGRIVPIYETINDIFELCITKFITFKAPVNFDMSLFKKSVNGTIRIYPIYCKPRSNSVIYNYVIVKKINCSIEN